jgi:hypothetical protein
MTCNVCRDSFLIHRGGFRGVSEVSGNPLLVISILHLLGSDHRL